MTSCNNTTLGACVNATGPQSDGTQPSDILRIIFGSLSILLNGTLLLAMYKDRKKLLVSRISYLVTNLAVADFLTGVVLVFIIQPIEMHERKQALVKLELPLIWAAMLVSFLTLFLMSAERFIVVSLPMLWSTILTTRRTIIGICITWCLAITSSVVVHFHRFKAFFAMIVIMEVCVVVFIGVHLYILRFLKKPDSKMPLTDDDEELQGTDATSWPSTERSNHVSMKQHGEVTAVVAILLSVLIVTTIPYFICVQILLAGIVYNDYTWGDGIDMKKLLLAYDYTDALSYLNFVVNPIVYAWRLSMYRRAFVKLFRSFCGA